MSIFFLQSLLDDGRSPSKGTAWLSGGGVQYAARADGYSLVGFKAGAGGDALALTNSGFTSFASFRAALSQVGSDTVVKLGSGETLTLRNTVAAALTPENLSLDHTLAASGAARTWQKAASATQKLTGTAGNDVLSTSFAVGELAGGAGDDVYRVIAETVIITEKANEGIDTVESWAHSYTLAEGLSVENLTLVGTGDQSGTGNALDNRIEGNAGANRLAGGRGNDVLTGGAGRDTFVMQAGDGFDVITDFRAKGAEADVIRLERYAYASLADLKGRMTQAGKDTMLWLSDTDSLLLKNVDLASLSAANFEFLANGKPMDLNGGTANDVLVGGSASDTIAGNAGNDTLTGGKGRDVFNFAVGDGSDTISDFQAGKGGDVLSFKGSTFASFADVKAAMKQVGSDTALTLGDGKTLLLKNASAAKIVADNVKIDYDLAVSGASKKWLNTALAGSTLAGTDQNDTLSTGVAGVTLRGGKGDDIYSILPSDTVVERAGEGVDTVQIWTGEGYALTDNVENLTLMSPGNAWLRGNALSNLIKGSKGDNTITGGGGNDILTGGGGNDVFVVAKGDGSDFVTDFAAVGPDRDAVSLQGFSFKSFADIAARMTQAGADTVLDLGGNAFLTLRNVQAATLSAENFLLPGSTAGLVQTFGDEFTRFSRDTGGDGIWTTRFSYGGVANYTLPSNGEAQLYVDVDFRGIPGKLANGALGLNPFSIRDGMLSIDAAPVAGGAKAYTGNYGWTSGLITTQSSFWQTYGYFEITAELPAVKGAWPAFWMLPVDGTSTTELDIFEYLGSRTDSLTSAVHSKSEGVSLKWTDLPDLAQGKHTFAAQWTPYGIDIFIDGKATAHYATPDDMSKPMYLLANLAMGGNWGGAPDAGAKATFKIDSIKAYQLEDYTLAGYKLQASAAATNAVVGSARAETLTGTDAADTIDGRGGADILKGGAGDDTYTVSQAGTVVVEKLGEGIDTVRSSVSFTLSANVENLILTGSDAIDATGNANANIVTGNAGDNVIRGGLGNDVLTGGGGKDTFVIASGDGSDVIVDMAAGPGAGDRVKLDGFWFTSFDDIRSAMSQHGDDVYLTLDKFETLVFRDHQVGDFAADDFILPAAPPESAAPTRWVIGTNASETLYGSVLDEAMQGVGGKDTLYGGDGDDTYTVGPGTLVVERAGQGIDTVESWLSSYTLTDHVENLTLKAVGARGTGNELANRMLGSAGNDVLDGKGGSDWLTGGAGADSFVFSTALDAAKNVDTITDFVSGVDRIVLDHSVFTNLGAAGRLAPAAFHLGEAVSSEDRIVYSAKTGELFYDADGVGGQAAVKFAQLAPNTALSHADFLIA